MGTSDSSLDLLLLVYTDKTILDYYGYQEMVLRLAHLKVEFEKKMSNVFTSTTKNSWTLSLNNQNGLSPALYSHQL